MRPHKSKSRTKPIMLMLITMITLSYISALVLAVPEGPTLSYVTNYTKVAAGAAGPYNNTGGYIYEYRMTITQVNNRWKAFVGNVTATLALTDSAYSIYSWTLAGNQTNGNVFASRNDTINWNRVICANSSLIAEEETLINVTSSRQDSIGSTFSASNHTSFLVNQQALTGCPTVYTYVNNSAQAANSNANHFQEILLASNYSGTGYNMIYSTKMEDNWYAYYTGRTYDFQMIVPDYGDTGIAADIPYYFYVELA